MEIRREIEIDATPERVWRSLTDFGSFPVWNPFIRAATGLIEENKRLTITLQPSGGRSSTFRPTVLRAEPYRELRWLGHLGVPGLFDGEHVFEIQPSASGGTHFVQRETFGGILVPILMKMMKAEVSRGFEEMNLALKKRAEGEMRPESRQI
ncbi:MAG TPA: SRPBCC domain-containing protein [Nitrososphaerales archaeon]|nr:SRPBCC domain-containing protein [Nitrososphaerales archaeon]